MATIAILTTTAFSSDDIWGAEQTQISSTGGFYRYQGTNGLYYELQGTFVPGSGTPTSGFISIIRVYSDATFTTQLANATNVAYTFSGGAYIGTPSSVTQSGTRAQILIEPSNSWVFVYNVNNATELAQLEANFLFT
jgi:hypothetical protein